ncbi:MAG: hypothetical protein ACLP9S_11140 [Syntrophales bacterium]|jgi:hypothetical protein
MANEIILDIEMCQREGVSLQRGMNYQLGGNHSVILMSVRMGAPYADRFDDDGSTLIYEGHDLPRSTRCPNPKSLDQEEDFSVPIPYNSIVRRVIPTAVKLEVWKRDAGRCAKGGSSTTAVNIQLLCARHNLEKHNKIE